MTVLRWTLERLEEIAADAGSLDPLLIQSVMPQLGIALSLLDEEPLTSVGGQLPVGEDMRAVAREGRPWNLVATVARSIQEVLTSPSEWATRLILPDDELRPTLFHLGVLGELLEAARSLGSEIVSTAPLSGAAAKPAYRLTRTDGAVWDLWFEAGSVWTRYNRSSPYIEASAGLGGTASPIKPDLMLVRLDDAALIFECKYSAEVGYVGRRGVTQAMAYAVEAKSRLAPRVCSYVVAPEGVANPPTATATEAGEVGITVPSAIAKTLAAFWST